ncbi:hypothetical protein AB0M07_42630, partial [Streptomyces sp. NPDC052015]
PGDRESGWTGTPGERGRREGREAGRGCHVADHEEWDAHFPDHPLTLVRDALRRITPTVTFDPRFTSLPPFGAQPAWAPPMPPAPPAL